MRAVTMPTFRRGNRGDRQLWGDLRMALHSLDLYGSDYIDEAIIAWDGPFEPDEMPDNPKIKLIRRPDGLDQAAAWRWAIEQTDADELIMMPDDVVLHPDSFRHLHEDLEILQSMPEVKPGIVTLRSNYVCGMQNVRFPNGEFFRKNIVNYEHEWKIIGTEVCFNVVSWFTRTAWEETGRFPEGLVWFGDVVMSYDLRQLGYQLFISRGYVHHIGMRGQQASGQDTERLHREGVDWLRKNRPDFLEYWINEGYLDPSEMMART